MYYFVPLTTKNKNLKWFDNCFVSTPIHQSLHVTLELYDETKVKHGT